MKKIILTELTGVEQLDGIIGSRVSEVCARVDNEGNEVISITFDDRLGETREMHIREDGGVYIEVDE